MRIYLGLVGCYRTFENCSKNLFTNLIDHNSQYIFDIYINTEYDQIYEHDKWAGETKKYYKYTQNDLENLFQKNYKTEFKVATYYTHDNEESRLSPVNARVKRLLNERNNIEYDLYIFMRMDCIFSVQLDLHNYINKLDKDMVKLICRDVECPERYDHNRDWDMGILSKNADNIYKWASRDYTQQSPDDRELKENLKQVKCNSVLTRHNLPLPVGIEKKYKSDWRYRFNCNVYSFNKQISPLWFEDEFFLSIFR